MKLNQICVSLELAKELKEAGYPQESLFYWGQLAHNGEFVLKNRTVFLKSDIRAGLPIAAPTASELGNELLGNIDEFVRENLDDLDTNLYMDWCNDEHPYYNPNLLAKIWLLLAKNNLLTKQKE